MTVAAYIRVSSKHKQADRWSLPAQREVITRYCVSQGWDAPRWYVEAHTAKDDDPDARPVFRQLLADAHARQFATVVIVDVDRFARSVVAGLDAAARLEKAGIKVVSLNDGDIDVGDPDGEFNFTLKLMLARRENRVRGRKTRAGMGAAKAAGKHITAPPYGARIGEDGRLELDPATAPILRRILIESATDPGDKVAARLTDDGIPPPGARRAESRWGPVGSFWWPNTVRWIVRQGGWLAAQPAPWPDLVRAAQARPYAPRVRNGLVARMLTGLCYCACGGKMTYTNGRGGRPFFNCRNPARRGTSYGCTIPRTVATHYEDLVLAAIMALPDPLTEREITEATDPAAWAELAEERRRLDLRFKVGSIQDEQFLAELAALDRRASDLPRGEANLVRLRNEVAPVLRRFVGMTPAHQNALLRQLVERIVIDGRHLTIHWQNDVRALFRLPVAA